MTYRAVDLLVAPGGCGRPVHHLLPMVWWVPELNGANVHHGLGGEFGILPSSYWIFSWSRTSKNFRFRTTTTTRQISYIGIRRISTGVRRSCHNSHSTMAPIARLRLGEGARCCGGSVSGGGGSAKHGGCTQRNGGSAVAAARMLQRWRQRDSATSQSM